MMRYWRHETMLTLVLIFSVVGGGLIGFIIGYTNAPEKKCRPEAISSTVSKDGITCVYDHPMWGVARRIEK